MLVTSDARFSVAPYVGKHGWVTFKIGTEPDWNEVEALVVGSYLLIAPKKLAAQVGTQGGSQSDPEPAAPKAKKPAAKAKAKPAAKKPAAKAKAKAPAKKPAAKPKPPAKKPKPPAAKPKPPAKKPAAKAKSNPAPKRKPAARKPKRR